METSVAIPMAIPAFLPAYTLADLDRFPDDGNRYELVDGFLLVTPGPIPPHELVRSRLLQAVLLHLAPAGTALVLPQGTVEIAPKTHLEPDLLVIPATEPMNGRWTAVRNFLLAVEVSGHGSRLYDRDFKRPAYLRAGVRTYWRVDLRDRCVYVSTPDAPAERRCAETVQWTPPGATEPFRLDVRALFEGVEGDE